MQYKMQTGNMGWYIRIYNPLYKLMDPLFIGTTISKGKNGKDQMGAKYIKKTEQQKIK